MPVVNPYDRSILSLGNDVDPFSIAVDHLETLRGSVDVNAAARRALEPVFFFHGFQVLLPGGHYRRREFIGLKAGQFPGIGQGLLDVGQNRFWTPI